MLGLAATWVCSVDAAPGYLGLGIYKILAISICPLLPLLLVLPQLGCMAGGAVVQTLGAEMGPAQLEWMHSRMHGELAGAVVRDSAAAVQQELLAAYALIEKRGRGVVYYGSARLRQDSPHWQRAVELGREVANLLGCTTW